MRTTINLPDEMVARLDMVSARQNKSRTKLIEESIALFLQENPPVTDAFGLWSNHQDGLEYQSTLRQEW